MSGRANRGEAEAGAADPTAAIRREADRIGRPVRIMEVCGTHTVALRRAGIPSLLPPTVSLLAGPGCPVCVTPSGYIDNAPRLVEKRNATVATFGDMVRVPGSSGHALSRHAGSGRVRVVYSPLDALAVARETNGPVVFLGIGFETTAPVVAAAMACARREAVANLFLYAGFRLVPPALAALLRDPDMAVDGFLLPGHVSAIIGRKAYLFLEDPSAPRSVPGAIAGFAPIAMLRAILALLGLVADGRRSVVNAYAGVVDEDGNPKARRATAELLEPADALWRGMGLLPLSGLRIRPEWAAIDAEAVFGLPAVDDRPAPGCLCGMVIRGKAAPEECALFGTACDPDRPTGPCMVSSEGTCAAHLRYRAVQP